MPGGGPQGGRERCMRDDEESSHAETGLSAALWAQRDTCAGTRVFHAAALGGEPPAEALEVFFGGLKLSR